MDAEQRNPEHEPRPQDGEPPLAEVDIEALKANLNRSVAERIRRHQIALDTFHMLRKAKRV